MRRSVLKAGKPLSKENLDATYVARRRASWVEEEGKVAEKARDGFHRGMIPGLLGMAIAGFTDGKHSVSGEPKLMPSPEEYYREKKSGFPDRYGRRAAHNLRSSAGRCAWRLRPLRIKPQPSGRWFGVYLSATTESYDNDSEPARRGAFPRSRRCAGGCTVEGCRGKQGFPARFAVPWLVH
jgi:hypothetical protein